MTLKYPLRLSFALLLAMLAVWATTQQPASANVSLDSFTLAFKNNAIEVKWRTGSELDVAAFVLYRRVVGSGDYVEVNRQAPKGDIVIGASYLFIDTSITAGTTYEYKLVEIENAGNNKVLKEMQVTAAAVTATTSASTKTATTAATSTVAATPVATATLVVAATSVPTATPIATATTASAATPSPTASLTSTATTGGGSIDQQATQFAAQTQLASNQVATATPQPTFTSIATQAVASSPTATFPPFSAQGSMRGVVQQATSTSAAAGSASVSSTNTPIAVAAISASATTPPNTTDNAAQSTALPQAAGVSNAPVQLDVATGASDLGGFFAPTATLDTSLSLNNNAPVGDQSATATSMPNVDNAGGQAEPTIVAFNENLPNTGGQAELAPTLDWTRIDNNVVATPSHANAINESRLSGELVLEPAPVQTPAAPTNARWLRSVAIGGIIFVLLIAIELALLTAWLVYRKYYRA